MVFPSHAIRSGNRLFGKQTEPQTDSEVTFLIALLCPQATFRRSSWCFNKWGTHNKAITHSVSLVPLLGSTSSLPPCVRQPLKSWDTACSILRRVSEPAKKQPRRRISHPGYGNYIRKGIKSWQCDAQTQHLNIFVTGNTIFGLKPADFSSLGNIQCYFVSDWGRVELQQQSRADHTSTSLCIIVAAFINYCLPAASMNSFG
ncbi:uncharacterized protein LOC118171773 isoform X2 [Oxyura jamaicensis]|uniref:uncharacterized protein LOC118171773 isoform X2 n=1 Tax=Oxyura jamaicensis TaxID=8884 RepID=UPI0015A70B1C|nr:uncharacterized protein LOC118171773 isoform X2 [Oxyura jamaicensis]